MTEEELVRALQRGVEVIRKARVPAPLRPVAYDRVLGVLLGATPPQPPPVSDGVWRCPQCGGRPQALTIGDGAAAATVYGCARGHFLVEAPAGAKLRA